MTLTALSCSFVSCCANGDDRYAGAMDPLADVMDVSRVSGAMLANVRAQAPWGLALPQSSGASFHALTSGTAWLRVEGAEPIQLMPGDVLLLPTGIPHRLSATPDGRCRPFDRTVKEQLMTSEGDLLLEGPGAVTTFVCAGYDYDHDVAHSLLSLLPAVLHMPADPAAGSQITTLVSLLAGELGVAGGWGACGGCAADRPPAHPRRPRVERRRGAAVMAARAPRPGRRARARGAARSPGGTVDDRVARRGGSSLARHARPALHRARRRATARLPHALADGSRRSALEGHTDPVQTIARSVGYTSEYAFNRAFSRHRGQPPGRYRHAA